MCELILPNVHFSGVHNGLVLLFHYRETKFVAICRAVYRNELHTGLLYFGYFLSGTCCQKLNVEWH